jgi:EAL domain-containing protein (putative c-di-GMP-specific phosphodiesterase class I)
MNLLDTTEKLRRDRVLIEALIEEPARLGPDFQPIKALSDGSVVGYKATGRGQQGTELDNTLALLESAQTSGLLERLDWAFRCLAFEVAMDRGVTCEVHLTPEPETFGSACPPRLATLFGRGRRELTVAAEVHGSALDHPHLEAAVEEWRGWGWKVVLADVNAHLDTALARLEHLRPDTVQVDLSDPALETDPRLRQVLGWATTHGAAVHAVGVDTPTRREQALDLGATAGRGRLLGAPGPL